MRVRSRFLVPVLFCLSAAFLALAQSASGKRVITEKDLFDFVWVANPQVSPDGARVAFTRVNVDAKRTGYETSIWTVSASGSESPIRMTNGKHDTQPRWSLDGKRLAFIRAGEKDESGKPQPPQLAVLSLQGGEAWTITNLPKGASNPIWSPDGKRIAFLSSTTPEDIQKQQAKAAKKPDSPEGQKNTAVPQQAEPESEHESDVHLITRAYYRDNDEGFLDPKRHDHIWIVNVPTTSDEVTKPLQLTSGNYDEGEPVWSGDGTRIYFLTSRIEEPYYELPTTDVYWVAPGGGEVQKLTTVAMGIGDLALSPDGRRMAFHGSVNQPVRSYSQPDLWVMDVEPNAKPRNLTADYDFDMGSGVGGDNAAPRGGNGSTLHWTADGRSLIDVVAKNGRSFLAHVDTQSGAVSEITRGDQAVPDFTVTIDGQKIVALISTPVMIGDLFAIGADGSQTRLTDMNHSLWPQLNLTLPE